MRFPSLACLITLPFAVSAAGQAIVERALITAGTTTGGAATTKNAGKSIGGVFEGLSKTIEQGGQAKAATASPAPASTANVSLPAPAPKTTPRPRVEFDPAKVIIGMDRAELVGKFGEPTMEVSGSAGAVTCWYTMQGGDSVSVTLAEGKVSAVSKPQRPKANRASVVVLP
jgi:hypothetical protein